MLRADINVFPSGPQLRFMVISESKPVQRESTVLVCEERIATNGDVGGTQKRQDHVRCLPGDGRLSEMSDDGFLNASFSSIVFSSVLVIYNVTATAHKYSGVNVTV